MRRNDIKPSAGNVFADLDLDDAVGLHARAELMSTVATLIAERNLSPAQVARLLGIDRPRVTTLMKGKLATFSSSELIGYLTTLDNDVDTSRV